ncbi:MAG: LexA family transcriptional regulator [Coxiellaceae bacterium]|nr:LexA family transcriptional regulator [Coxiellaceae bacterium]
MAAQDSTLDTLSKRLKVAMQNQKITQASLARTLNINPAAIQYLLASNAKSSRFTFELAHALDVNASWLASGVGPISHNEDPHHQLTKEHVAISLLDIYQITDWKSNTLQNTDIKNWILSTKEKAKYEFAFTMPDSSMFPQIPKNTTIIANLNTDPRDQQFVLADIADHDELIFRQLSVRNNTNELIPFNENLYKTIKLQPSDKIIATACEVRIKF